MPRRLITIINATAGADCKQAIAERLSEVFRSDDIEARVLLAHSGAEVATMARAAVREQPDIVVAGGGDGTMINGVSVIDQWGQRSMRSAINANPGQSALPNDRFGSD